MPSILTRFRVIALHGLRTIDVHLVDNRLVIVGENGSGKSTAANLIYYFLSQQWNRLRDYRFSCIEATIGDEEFRVTPEQIELFRESRSHVQRQLPLSVQRALFRVTADHQIEELLENEDAIAHLSYELGLTPRRLRDVLLRYLEEDAVGTVELQSTAKKLREAFREQLLYLPTYRRIEQDLKSIFRGVESEIRQFRERVAKSRAQTTFVELVEFGMEDVERTLNSRMTQIKENVRTGLNNLTGTYLRDVIRGVHVRATVERLQSVEPSTLESMFARIDEVTLPQRDKDQLRRRVADILGKATVDTEDKVVAHFLSRLLELYKAQQESERDVREFVRVCNDYLVGKEVVYDDLNYAIFIRATTARSETRERQASLLPADAEQGDGERLELKMLSSGEKQIVSLFSHIYLSGDKTFFVIIDEPELSLSVPWQRRFLPDILRTGHCSGLVAVTHSPFIWENELEPYVHSLSEFFEPANVVCR